MTLNKVISGGQTGVDTAALSAAAYAGLKTGGTAPKGWRTLDGPAPWLSDFGLREHASSAYPPRTEQNVIDSDATLRIADDFGSPGELLTLKLVRRHAKPSMDVHGVELARADMVDVVASWLSNNDVTTLNVAGNSEKTAPGIQARSEAFLKLVFKRAQGKAQ